MKLYNGMSVVWLMCVTSVWAAQSNANTNTPHIGYLYPAGVQQGTTTRIVCCGQFLRNPQAVTLTGDGIQVKVVEYVRSFQTLNKDQREWLQKRLRYVQDLRLAEQNPGSVSLPEMPAEPNGVKLPQHPLLYDLDHKTLRELAHIRTILFAPKNKQQPNRQLTECVILEVTADANVTPGPRELRLVTSLGITNPMVFQVGRFKEVQELEPNNGQTLTRTSGLPGNPVLPEPNALTLPVVLNGQILPGDADRFQFHATQGSHLVIKTHARTLIPYLADAVPGWFQAVVTLYDDQGKEVAYADDDRFHPDPVLYYELPRTGDYELEVRDAIYRGREDFVYRIEVGDPCSIPRTALPLLDTSEGLPVVLETASQEVMEVNLPILAQGCIDPAGDTDVYRFAGHARDTVVMEVQSRSLDASLDSLVRLIDASGKVIAWNDDYVVQQAHLYKDPAGLSTHHADSYLMTTLPGNGLYDVQISDAQQHGGPDFVYRLRVARAQGDFALRTAQSGLAVRAGSTVDLTVHALRKDGFNGAIELSLAQPSYGFVLQDAQIPEDKDQTTITLKAPRGRSASLFTLHLQGAATIHDKTVTHEVVPADDVMQAFLYRHLVPAETLTVVILNNGPVRFKRTRAK